MQTLPAASGVPAVDFHRSLCGWVGSGWPQAGGAEGCSDTVLGRDPAAMAAAGPGSCVGGGAGGASGGRAGWVSAAEGRAEGTAGRWAAAGSAAAGGSRRGTAAGSAGWWHPHARGGWRLSGSADEFSLLRPWWRALFVRESGWTGGSWAGAGEER